MQEGRKSFDFNTFNKKPLTFNEPNRRTAYFKDQANLNNEFLGKIQRKLKGNNYKLSKN